VGRDGGALHFIIYGCRVEYEFILFMKQVSQATSQTAKKERQPKTNG